MTERIAGLGYDISRLREVPQQRHARPGTTVDTEVGIGLQMTSEYDEVTRLLLRTAKNDRQSFSDLYRQTSPRLLSVCVRMLREPREAEEVLQEVYIIVWQRARAFDPARSSALTWLIALTRNKVIDRLRQRPNATVNDGYALETLADEKPTPATSAEAGQEYERLRNCLEELESHQRLSIQEAFFSGMTYSALATRTNVPLGTLKSWIRRGLLQLRACLEV
jgi:RNA polymerase sigma-70 factor, ECF subfamily